MYTLNIILKLQGKVHLPFLISNSLYIPYIYPTDIPYIYPTDIPYIYPSDTPYIYPRYLP